MIFSRKGSIAIHNSIQEEALHAPQSPEGGEASVDLRGIVFALGQIAGALRCRENDPLRGRADLVMNRLRERESLEDLIACLQDEDTMIRRGAAWALGMMGDALALEPLTQALADSDWEVRSCAQDALDRLRKSALL